MTLTITWMWLVWPLAGLGAIVAIPVALWALWHVYFLVGFLIKGDEWG
jgi:hypothetical protein